MNVLHRLLGPFAAAALAVACVGDPGIQLRVRNATETTLTVYEDPRQPRFDLVLDAGQESWMMVCQRYGLGPCNVTIRAIDRSGVEVFCRRYEQEELSQTGRVEVTRQLAC